MTPGGILKSLYNFCSQANCTDGAVAFDGLALGTDGNFYGTTYFGGANNLGTVFKVTPRGTLTTLHDFGGADGQYPIGSVLQATNGLFYGTTGYGGASGDGQIFSLSVGLRPFVKTVPAFGKSGAPVIILGNRLRSATGVTFNGRATSFKVISAFQIMALVPPGATTGIVKVRTPRGTLSSNVPFQVLRQ